MGENGQLATKGDLKAEIASAKADLRAEIASVRTDLSAEIAAVRTDFTAALAATRAELRAEIQAQDQRFQGRMDVLEQRLRDAITQSARESEIKLLQAFYTYAQADDKRHRTTETTVAGVVERLATVESRLLAVEKHLNLPPAA